MKELDLYEAFTVEELEERTEMSVSFPSIPAFDELFGEISGRFFPSECPG